MSAIEQVIARARMAGEIGFSERRQFKLARARAIEKLRRFALADPYFYILELIQAAIANGATHVDIGCGEGEGDEVRISWIGGQRLREAELAQLFDFLFAAKERLDLADVRSLALGVNALLLFAPSSIVIESGDGSPEGTSRMVIRQGIDQVEVGRAQGSLAGTYVKVFGLDRAKVAAETNRHGTDEGGLEYATIELRCLAAPVPIVFNGQSVFGWSRQKIPRPFGYRKIIEFDEGDLYGALALDPEGGVASFQLLTHGVWIQTYQNELLAPHKLGGIVCFDRLHKTVDHSGFVRDEVFEELWIRLRPYAEQLVGGQAAHESPKITNAGGVAYSIGDLRALLGEHPRVLAIAPELEGAGEGFARAEALAKLLDAEILRVPEAQLPALRVLGGRGVLIWRPELDPDTDVLFYARPALPEPAGPLLLPAVSLASIASGELATVLQASTGRSLAELVDAIGQTGECTATLHSPADPSLAGGGLRVRILSAGRRLVGERSLASAWAGRIVDVELPTCSPTRLTRLGAGPDSTGEDLPTAIAEHFAGLASAVLIEQDRRTLAGLGVGELPLGSPAARLALQVLARALVTRLRGVRPGRASPGLSFSLLHAPPDSDPLELPLLTTLSGRNPIGVQPREGGLSLRDLALLADLGGGLIYAVVPEVPADLEGLDRDRILALDLELERLILGLLGETGYVRVDARDVLARASIAGREFVVRDVALGLRGYPEFPILLEGDDPSGLDPDDRRRLLASLLDQLGARARGELDDPTQTELEREEHRRQAIRHLQWAVCRLAAAGRLADAPGLDRLPLFLDLDGEAWSLASLLPGLQRGRLIVHYGHGFATGELARLAAALRVPEPIREHAEPESLAISAFVLRLLAPLGRVRLAFDFDLDDHEAARGPWRAREAFLVRESLELAGARCVFGIPAAPTGEVWLPIGMRDEAGTRVIGLLEPPIRGVVGSIEVDARGSHEALVDALERELPAIGERLLDRLLARLPELEVEDQADRRRTQALQIAFDYAGEQLQLIGERGLLHVALGSALADRVLALPVFDLGGPTLVPAQRLVEQFRRHWTHADDPRALAPLDWSRWLAADTPAPLRAWLDRHLTPARVILPASRSASSPIASTPSSKPGEPWPRDRRLDAELLAWNLGVWLARLRPDDRRSPLTPASTRPPTRVWVFEYGSADESLAGRMVAGNDERLEFDGSRLLVQRTLADPTPAHLAWLLLAAYAHLNEVTVAITNLHEQEFQRRVAAALLDGTLTLLHRA
ncbi:hypothetical protein ACNOYE_01105 [Nannocystaceae bacterium ST9]